MARNCNHAVRVRAVSYAVPFIAPCASLGACAGSHARVYVFGCECVRVCARVNNCASVGAQVCVFERCLANALTVLHELRDLPAPL